MLIQSAEAKPKPRCRTLAHVHSTVVPAAKALNFLKKSIAMKITANIQLQEWIFLEFLLWLSDNDPGTHEHVGSISELAQCVRNPSLL